MDNPNKLTGETVLEKLKFYLTEVENKITRDIGEHYNVREGLNIRDDFKWCMEQIELSSNEGYGLLK